MRYYSGDPYWTEARYNGKCACGKPVAKGDRIFYFPKGRKGKKVHGEKCGCGISESERFEEIAAAEFAYNGF